jgi:hypothetical protein
MAIRRSHLYPQARARARPGSTRLQESNASPRSQDRSRSRRPRGTSSARRCPCDRARPARMSPAIRSPLPRPVMARISERGRCLTGNAAAWKGILDSMTPMMVLCPNCSYCWTVVPAVSRSWACPSCGGHRDEAAVGYECSCTHTYGHHKTAYAVENSLEAFVLPGLAATDEVIDRLPHKARPPEISFGTCRQCSCKQYRRREAPSEG